MFVAFNFLKKIVLYLFPYSIFKIIRKNSIELLWTLNYLNKKKRYKNADLYKSSLKNKSGLEIGGPSWIWITVLPIYQCIRSLDNIVTPSLDVNKNINETTNDSRYRNGQIINVTSGWENATEGEGKFNWFLFKRGKIIFQDATNLSKIDSDKYDFVLCSNVLEHIANPIKALNEFKRVIKKNGHISIVVPYYKNTFDYKRPITTLDHLKKDFINSVGEDDLTHLDEVVRLTDESSIDHNAQPNPNFDRLKFAAYCRDNYKNRGMHHHVYDTSLLASIAEEVDLKVLDVDYFSTSCVILAQKK